MKALLWCPLALLFSCAARDFDGRHNAASVTILGIPVATERRDVPVIAGDLLVECGPILMPVSGHRIVVEQGDTLILETTTDPSGKFRVSGDLPNGTYRVRVDASRLVGAEFVTISGYEVPPVHLVARCHR